ncbi:MAG TPA: hypothetical protein VFX84_00690 [Candidatus Saccharimonadales bacterium]|nr:hypothetical protein [Candidatus Saccharimonadales bacterium]
MSESRSPALVPGQYEIPADPVRAQEQFWSQWGEKAGFGRQQFETLWTDAGKQYIDLAHHNFDHAQRVLWDAMCLADACEGNGIEVNRKALIGAALFHDAGYYQRAALDDTASKEAYAARILRAYATQQEYGMSTEDIVVGIQAILSTEVERVPVSIEDKILVRADLMNIGGDYKTSVTPTTERLLEEARVLEGTSDDPAPGRLPFMHRSIRVIAGYLVHDLSLGPFDKKEWLEQAVGNLLRMIRETAAEESRSASDLVKELGSSAVTKLFNRQHAGTSEQSDYPEHRKE